MRRERDFSEEGCWREDWRVAAAGESPIGGCRRVCRPFRNPIAINVRKFPGTLRARPPEHFDNELEPTYGYTAPCRPHLYVKNHERRATPDGSSRTPSWQKCSFVGHVCEDCERARTLIKPAPQLLSPHKRAQPLLSTWLQCNPSLKGSPPSHS